MRKKRWREKKRGRRRRRRRRKREGEGSRKEEGKRTKQTLMSHTAAAGIETLQRQATKTQTVRQRQNKSLILR